MYRSSEEDLKEEEKWKEETEERKINRHSLKVNSVSSFWLVMDGSIVGIPVGKEGIL